MVASDYPSAVWGRLKRGCRALFRFDGASQSDENQRQSRFQVEPLEPRILLSGDPVMSELARLVDDATHAMFVDDHAAVVEQLKTDVVADAGHADRDAQGVVVSSLNAGDERGVEWPSEWTQPVATENAGQAGKVDLRMAIGNLVAAFAAEVSVEGAARGHLIAKLAKSGQPDGTAPATVTIEDVLDAGVAPTGSTHESDQIQTLLKDVLSQVLAAFAAHSNDAAGQAAAAGLEIRMASLGAGEVARIDGNVILVDDDGGGAGWAFNGVAAADLGSLAILAEAASRASDAGPPINPMLAGIAAKTGPPASSDGFVVAVSDITVVMTTAPTAAAADPAPLVAFVSRAEAIPAPEHTTTASAPVPATTAPAVAGAVTLAPTAMPVEAAPAAQSADGGAVVPPISDYSVVEPALADALLGLLALAAAAPASVVDSRASEQRRAARTGPRLDGGPSSMTGSTTATVTSGAASVDDAFVAAPALASVAEVETASSALAVDIMSAATAEVVPLPLAGDQVEVAPISEVDMARGPPGATMAARGPPSADYLLADASSPLASAPATLSTVDLQSLVDLALAIWSDALAAKGLALPAGAPTFLISDLADGILGSTDGSTIRIDIDAAGHGWFVDATPRDASEFPLVLGTDRFGAVPGSAAAGATDLLTVLLHEIGHWAGYDHDSGIALMAAVLGTGQRVVLDLDDAVASTGQSVSGFDQSGGILTLGSAGTITITGPNAVTVSGTSTDDGNYTNVTTIVGSSGTDTIIGTNGADFWNLAGVNAGTVNGISFSAVENLTGGEGDDRVVVVDGATGLASFDGEGGFDSVVNRAGAAPTISFFHVENFIDRPLLFIPGFAGSFVDTTLPDLNGHDALEQWYLTRGIDPTKLVLEPLTNGYSDLIQTLVNAGYTDGTNKAGVNGTLYVSLWDWRVPVAITSDGLDDGVLSDVTAASIRDWAPDSFDSGLDYLAYWMDQAAQAWTNLTGATATAVDVITHSTGGLVARAYLQSAAYNNPPDNLLPVNTLIQTGVPNQGMGGAIAVLANDFSANLAARGGGNLINAAYDLLKAGETITNPDGSTISNAATPLEFVSQYVATFKNLLAVYPFLDNGGPDLVSIVAADGGNTLLLDLNADSPADFVGTANRTYVVYSAAVDTPDLAILHTGLVPSLGLQNEILPFDRTIGRLPAAGEGWYEIQNSPGDGTVSAFSASDGFESLINSDGSSVLVEIEADVPGGPVAHTEIQHNEYSQRQILRLLLGVDGSEAVEVSTGLLLDTKEQVVNLIALGVIDPVELARDAFSNAKDLLADIYTRFGATLNQELPLIGKSLNQLLSDAGFDLFGAFASASAPAASLLTETASLADRFAELGHLLENALQVPDGAIQIVYDAAELKVDITFDFNLGQVLALNLDEFGLNLGLGIAFTLSLDLTELIAVSAGGSSDGGSQLTLALSSSVEIDTAQFDLSGTATAEIALSDLFSGQVPDITLTGDATIDLGGYVLLAGGFGLSRSSQSGVDLGDGLLAVDLLRIDLVDVDLFVGVGGVFDTSIPDHPVVDASAGTGFFVDGANLSLAIASVADAPSTDTRRWTGVVASADTLQPVGLPEGFELRVDNLLVLFNSASGDDAATPTANVAVPIDWSVLYPDETDALNALTDGTALSVSGQITIDLGGYVLLAGGFGLSKSSQSDVDLGDNGTLDVDLLRIELVDVDLFVGVGGVFDRSDADHYAVDTSAGTGFFVDGANLSLAIARVTDATSTDTRRWLGVVASADSLGPAGLPTGFELHLDNLSVLLNSASGDDGEATPKVAVPINWSALYTDDTDPLNALSGETALSVSGDITIDLDGYVLLAGGFAVNKTTPSVDLLGEGVVDVDLLRIDLVNVDLFLGVGGVLDTSTPGAYGVDAINGTGFFVGGANLSLAIASLKDDLTPPKDTRRWTGIAVSADTLQPVGLPEGFELRVDNLLVLFNSASGDDGATPTPTEATPLDWSVLYPDDTDALNALSGETALSVSGDITIDLDGFVLLAGGFAVTKTTPSVDLLGEGVVDVDLLRIDLVNVDLFLGVGGVLDTSTPGAYGVDATNGTGFFVAGANLSLAIASLKDDLTPPKDTRRWTGIAVSADTLQPVGLPTGFELRVDNLLVLFNSASGDDAATPTANVAVPIDWSVLYPDETDALNALSDGTALAVSGQITIDLDGYVLLAGGFGLSKSSQSGVVLGDNGTLDVDLLRIELVGVDLFVGVGGVFDRSIPDDYAVDTSAATGFFVDGANLSLAIARVTDATSTDTRRWLGVVASADSLGPAGLPTGFELHLDNLEVLLNSASGDDGATPEPKVAVPINWSALYTDDTDALHALSAETALSVSGDITIDLDGFVLLAGGFAVTKTTPTVDLVGNNAEEQVELLRIDLVGVDLFLGVGGELENSTPGAYGVDATNGTGFFVDGANLSLAIASLKDDLTPPKDTRRWIGIAVSADTLQPVGLPTGFELRVDNLLVLVNSASGTDGAGTAAEPLDWSKLYPNANDPLNALRGNLQLSVSGELWVDLSGFVQVFGGFALSKSTMDVTLAGETQPTTVDALTFGFDSVDVFVGAGPYFKSDGTLDAKKDDAVGLLLTDVTLAVGLFKRVAGPGTGSYYAISAFAETFELKGLELGGSDTFSLEASGYRIEVNGGSTGAINFAALDDGKLTVATSGQGSVDFDYSSALQRVAIENATLIIGDYVYISGGFSFTRQTDLDVTLSGIGSGGRTVNAYAFGAGNVDVFVGSGPYFIDSDHDGVIDSNDDAVGLALENVNFGLIVMRPTDVQHKSEKYIALKATADFAGLVGIDGFKLSAAGISVEYNTGGANGAVNFAVDGGYMFDTGNGELEIDYAGPLLRATVVDAQLQIDSYVFIRGGMSFEKGGELTVPLNDELGTEKVVSAINVGAQDLNIFIGVNGPYWTDLDGDLAISWVFNTGDGDEASRTITDGEVTIGGEVYDVSNPILPANAVASVASGVVTVGGVQHGNLNGNDKVDVGESIELNPDAIGFALADADLALTILRPTDTTDKTRYTAVEASAESVGFVGFDKTVFALEASSVVVELNLASEKGNPGPLPVVDFSRLNLVDGAYSIVDAGEEATGYAIITGADTTWLTYSAKRIHVSADDVLLNVAEFLYVNGNIALDLGSRETVTINTGVPSSLGSLAQDAGAVKAINDALIKLSGQLDTLEGAIAGAVGAAIDALKAEVTALLADVIDSIVVYLQDELSSVISSVTALTEEQLNAAVGSVRDLVAAQLQAAAASFSADTLLNNLLGDLISDAVSGLPSTLQDLVGGLLAELASPIRRLVSKEFDDILQEAIVGSIDRVAASVSGAIQAGLESVAATAEASISEAIGAARESIEDAIEAALDPQFDRIAAKLTLLSGKVTTRLAPLFDKLHGIADIRIGEGFSTMTDVEVEVTAIGISQANAFVGFPPAGGLDFDADFEAQGAIGLFIQNFSMALGLFKPVGNTQLPSFTAAKIHVDTAGFSDGDPDSNILTLIAKGIDVALNLGGPIVKGASLLGNATIDFVASFEGDPAATPDPIPAGYAVQTGTNSKIYLDFESELIRASVEHAVLTISEFVHITGSIAFEKGGIETVTVTGGLLTGVTGDIEDALAPFGVTLPDAFPILKEGDSTQLSFMTIGASNVHAFVGIDGPYWTDSDSDGVVDSGELSDKAKGLWIQDFDFGLAIMRPTLFDFIKYFALKASADDISIVGIEGVEIDAHDIQVEINQSTPSVYGVPLFPVVNFASTFNVDERQALFDVFAGADHVITTDEMKNALAGGYTGAPIDTVEKLVEVLNVGGAPPGVLTLDEVLDQLKDEFKDATVDGKSNYQRILEADADSDGKFDPVGYEVNTGGDPVYLTMNSELIRAQGFLELNLFDTIFLTGSVAFELGPRQHVVLTDGTAKEVTTMTIGAADVTAFIGTGGPYWSDTNGDHQIDPATELNANAIGFHITNFDIGVMVMAAFDPLGLDLGLYLAAKASASGVGLVGVPGLSASGRFDVELNVGIGASGLALDLEVVDFKASFSEVRALFDTDNNGSVTVAELRALAGQENDGAFAGLYESDAPGADVVSLAALVAALDANHDGQLLVSEAQALLSSDNASKAVAADKAGDGVLDIEGAFAVNTGNPTAPVVLDFDELLITFQLGGSITVFSDAAKTTPVVKLNGLLLFEVTDAGPKAFVVAGLEFGPDIGSTSKFFNMNALGALVINGDGIAADIDVSVTIGAALPDLTIDAGAHARLVLNTTGDTQSITIPERYVGFLDGTLDLSSSALGSALTAQGGVNVAALESLVIGGALDDRFTLNPDQPGSLIFSISASAPTMASLFPDANLPLGSALASSGPYFAVAISAHLGIGGFTLEGRFGLIVGTDGLQLLVEAKMDFFNAVQLNIMGQANFVTTPGSVGLVLKITASLKAGTSSFGMPGLFDFTANLELQMNTRPGDEHTTLDAKDLGIARHSFRIDVQQAQLELLKVITLNGSGYIAITQGVFQMQVNLSGEFLSIVSVSASAFFSSEGEFQLILDGSIQLGPDGFNINGSAHLDVRYFDLNNELPKGTGSKVLKIFGQLKVGVEIFFIPISAELDVSYDGETGDITVRAGPVPVPAIGSYELDLGIFGSVTIYYPTIEWKYWTFTVGTLLLTKPPVPELGVLDAATGVLTLNMGSQANRTARHLAGNEINEEVNIDDDGAGTTSGRRNIIITMFGVSHTFENVAEVVLNADDGNDSVQIGTNVVTKVTANLGTGNDTLTSNGSGVVIASGNDGDDNLKGGSGNDQLDGGAGLDVLEGGPGADQIRGGLGDDVIIWRAGDGTDTTIDGQGGSVDTFRVFGTDSADTVVISRGTSGFTLTFGSTTLTVNGVEVADLLGLKGADSFTINDLTSSVLQRVSIALGDDNVQDSVTVNGSGSGDTFGFGTERFDRKEKVPGAQPGDTTEITVTVDKQRLVKTDGTTTLNGKTFNVGAIVDILDATAAAGDRLTLNTMDGADTINVGGTIAGLATTVNGGAGDDTFNVGNHAPVDTSKNVNSIAGSLTINGDDPTSGSDWLYVDDSGDTLGNTGTLTSTQVSGLGMVVPITYGTVEHVVITLGSGGDTFTIESTHSGETVLNAGGGTDVVNVRSIAGTTTVNGDGANDTFNIGSTAPVTVDGIGAALTVNGNASTGTGDVLNVNDSGDTNDNTGTLTDTTITGLDMAGSITYGTLEQLTISLGGGNDAFTINSTHGAATVSSQETTTLNAGAGIDIIYINDVTDLLFVNGQAGADTINVNGTGSASVSTLNGDAGNDKFNVRAMNGAVNVNGGDDDDIVNVGSDAPTPQTVPTTQKGTVDAINELLTVNGGSGIDTLNVDDSDPADNAKSGTLTSSTIRGLALDQGINYATLETLNIWLAFGSNTFTIDSTHTGQTTVFTAQGSDTVNINGASGTLTVNAEVGDDTINVRGTGAGSTANLNGQDGADTFNLSDASHKIDGIDGLVVIDGGANSDTINVDDSGNTANKAGTLTSSTLRGLEMPTLGGVNYSNAEDFNLWLGTGTDGLFIDSTHAGTTDVYMGNGNATTNQRDDTVAIKSISGVTTVHGQGGNDFFHVNVDAAANDNNFYLNFKNAAANDNLFNALFHRTNANGIAAVLNLHGEGDSDVYTVNLAGEGNALINVHDNGAPDNGVDTLIINGADVVAGLANHPDDTFLLRHDFVALLNASVAGGAFDRVERVNYDENINARLIVNGLGGNDKFVADDNSAITTLDGGAGNDTFQIGQVFGTPRDAAAGLVGDDVFATTPVIIGIIRNPNPSSWVDGIAPVIFDPTSFDPVFDVLPPATIIAINTAIAYQRNNGGLALDGIAYVSPGVTYATTVFGGAGEDIFSVYHNKGTLRLEGEAGNDQFVVRAFVTLDLSVQGDTEVNGGDGADTINYAINAPVSIDGGAGFDRVVVLGTPFNDNFVITSKGIFGAGLNVTFVNVESAELDTLEGNDTIYILGTSPDIITTVIGGLGGDTIQVMGDVTLPIVSNDLQGRSGVITQGLSSGADPTFDAVGVNGVAVNVVSAAGDSLVNIQPTGEPLRVTEDGAKASYFISLVAPNAAALAINPVYLTVSAGVASSSDRSVGGAGVLVSTDNVTFTNAVVLKFDGTPVNKVFQIWVKAIDDSAPEGPRVALISHSIISNNPAYDALPLIDIFVNVVDNDQPGLDIRHLIETAPNVFAPDTTTEVLEGAGASGFTDVYSIALTAAPALGEVVTVKLLPDGQVATSVTELTFTHINWMTPQIVRVSAVDDGLDGIEFSTIRHQVTSTGGSVYAGFSDQPKLAVTVYDNETPGVVVQETNGSTVVVENGADDSYRVRLTSAPSGDVTLTMRTDKQTFLTSAAAGFTVLDQTGTKSYFEYSFKFTTTNWHDWVVINVSANPNFAGTNEVLKAFPPQDQNLDQIRGPLIIEGGLGSAGADRSLQAPLLLPGETNKVSAQNGNPPSSEPGGIDTLNVFHTDNSDLDTGRLFYRTLDGLNQPIANWGLALTGFEMGGDMVVDQGIAGLVYYGGGITYNGFEIVEVLLGKGNERLTIDDTGDRDEKAHANPDPATITAIHGGGGSDTIIANDRGNGPLVIYGDTSEDGIRYSNNLPAASVHGTKFNNPGADTINASAMVDQADGFVGVVIYGGAGNDTIKGSQDDDHLAGGSGDDTIYAQAGNDHVYGDSAFNVSLPLFAQDQITPLTNLSQINAMFTVPIAGSTGADTIHGDAGDDIVFGDHGVIDQVPGTRRLQTTGLVTRVETLERLNGKADTIYGDGGEDVLIGGPAGDRIDGGSERDLIFGDNVLLDRTIGDGTGNARYRTLTGAEGGQIYSTIPATAGAVLVNGGSNSIPGGGPVWEDFNIQLLDHDLTTQTDAGNDFGNDYIAGGPGADQIFGELGNDVIQGDGSIDLVVGAKRLGDGTLSVQYSVEAVTDGDDYIEGNGGNDVIFGNLGQDDIIGGSSSLFSLSAPAQRPDGSDMIFGGAGTEIVRNSDEIQNLSVTATAGSFTLSLGAATTAVIAFNANASTIQTALGNLVGIGAGNVSVSSVINGSATIYTITFQGSLANQNIAQLTLDTSNLTGTASIVTQSEGGGPVGGHARDADMILGDNGNIYRVVGTPGFNYDDGYGEQIVVRAAQLLDYTPGGADYNAAGQALDIGLADELHGESGDDFIYGMVGNDVLFGEGQDDAIVGGYGSDWISGGTGDDGVLGDDGRIFTSRNSISANPAAPGYLVSLGEPLYGILPIPAGQLNTIIENSNGDYFAITNVAGALKYTVDLTPYSVVPGNAAPTTLMPRALYANDIIYGGLGNDALHGGAGEDAISGAEAPGIPSYVTNYNQAGALLGAPIRSDYAHPFNPGNVLGYNPITTKFALYDANDPLRKILLTATGPAAGTLSKTGSGLEWALNFNETEGPLDTHWIIGTSYAAVPTDGDDVIFGDLGHDWMVGGTGRDTVWAGWGDDLVNIDDVLTTSGGLNNKPEPNPSWEDFTYGGAGRDVLIGNTGGDRLIDWNGEQNTFVLPYNPFGLPTVSRGLAPALEVFMVALAKSQGADPTLAAQYNSDPARNGEPFGELGMVRQGDAAMGDQNGGPRDPQGPLSKSKVDVKGSAGVTPLWETAAGAVAAGSEGSSISESTLASAVEEAKLRWTEMLGAGDIRLAALNSVNVQVGNLPGDRIGVTLGQDIYIDSDAAGRGWQTMDLASVVMHELGHVLGFDHDDADAIPVMNGTLDAGAHDQLGTAGNTAASLGLAGFFTGADMTRQVIDQQSSDTSIVTPAAKSAPLMPDSFAAALPKAALLAQGVAEVPIGTGVETVPTALAEPVVAPVGRPLVGNLSDVPAPVQNGAGRATVGHQVRKPIPEASDAMPAHPEVEPIFVTLPDGERQQSPAPSFEAAPNFEAAPDPGVDWLTWLERLARLAEGRPEEPLHL